MRTNRPVTVIKRELQPETPFDAPTNGSPPNTEPIKRGRGRPPEPRDENGNRINPVKPRERKKAPPRVQNGARVVEAKPQKKTIITLPLCEKVLGKFYGVEQSQKFINYWKSIPENLQDAITVHVYRKWPVIDRTIKDPEAKQTIDYIIGTCPFISEDWREDLLKMYGEGDYQLFLNEGNVNIVKSLIRVRSNDYPPLLGDYKELVITDPANKSFVNMLRLRGVKLPGDEIPETAEQIKAREEKEEEEKEEMSAAESLGKVTEALMGHVMNDKQNPVSLPPVVKVESDTERKATGLMEQAAHSAISIISETAKQAIQDNSKKDDPFQAIGKIIDLAKALQPPAPPPDQSLRVFEGMFKAMQEESRTLRQELADVRREQLTKSTSASEEEPEKPKTMMEQLQEMKDMRESLDEMFGGGKGRRRIEDETPKSIWESLGEIALKQLPTLLPGIMQLVSALPTIVHNAAVAKNGGVPMAPPPVPLPNPTPQIQQPAGLQLPPEVLSYLNTLPEQDAQGIISIYPRLQQLEAPLLKHMFDPELGGYHFAEYIINSSAEGRTEYEGLRGIGREGMVKVLQAYPPVWTQVRFNPTGFEEFLKDFLDHDRIMMEEDDDDEEDQPIVPGPRKVS